MSTHTELSSGINESPRITKLNAELDGHRGSINRVRSIKCTTCIKFIAVIRKLISKLGTKYNNRSRKTLQPGATGDKRSKEQNEERKRGDGVHVTSKRGPVPGQLSWNRLSAVVKCIEVLQMSGSKHILYNARKDGQYTFNNITEKEHNARP